VAGTAEAVLKLKTSEITMREYYSNELSSKRLFALWHSIGSGNRDSFKNIYCDLKSRFDQDGIYIFNQYARTLFKDLRAEFGRQESGLYRKLGSEYALCGKTANRATGRATKAEEQVLRNLDRGEICRTTKSHSNDRAGAYRDFKNRIDEDGWSAFDKKETMLFDELTAEFGGATIDMASSGAFQKSTF
jgi:hypothetical protein